MDRSKGGGDWPAHATNFARQLVDRFGEESVGGFYFTDRNASDLIVRQKTATDSPLPSGNAVAAMVLIELGETSRAHDTLKAFAQQTEDHAEGMSSMVQAFLCYLQRAEPFTVVPSPGAATGGRPLSPLQVAMGVVTATARWESDTRLLVGVSIVPGYHINAQDVHDSQTQLIATHLNVLDEEDDVVIHYPSGEEGDVAFSDAPIRVYTGEISISVQFNSPRRAQGGQRLSITYQACDDRSCLPPVTKPVVIVE